MDTPKTTYLLEHAVEIGAKDTLERFAFLQKQCTHKYKDLYGEIPVVAAIRAYENVFYVCQNCNRIWENDIPEDLKPRTDWIGGIGVPDYQLGDMS